LWGALTAGSLVVGSLIALAFRPNLTTVGLCMGFGAGALISAVSFEMVGSALGEIDGVAIATSMLLGASVFIAGDYFIDRAGGHGRKHAGESSEHESGGMGIVVGTVVDGIPESIVLGIALTQDARAGAALMVAVFASNLPEAVGATTSLERSGWKSRTIVTLWLAITFVSALATVLGYALFDAASGHTGARMEAFAAGAILAMLADTMMPEAFGYGGRWVGTMTVLGFILGMAFAEM
jgi:ZIP family zinc transporter